MEMNQQGQEDIIYLIEYAYYEHYIWMNVRFFL